MSKIAITLSGNALYVKSSTPTIKAQLEVPHSMVHSMSACRHNLSMISRVFYDFFIDLPACDGQFIEMAKAMGIENAAKPENFITALIEL